ncbi:hypothetical protein ACFXMT_41190 [Streptomyces mirabilis]|uniref:hypothetical protein n=1 Tax=Streptomyces mirabilis TaxID=68239 RepID=UPI003681F65A
MFLTQHDSDTYVDPRRTFSADQNLLTGTCSPVGHPGLRGADGIFQSDGLERLRRAAGMYGCGGMDGPAAPLPTEALKRRSAAATGPHA